MQPFKTEKDGEEFLVVHHDHDGKEAGQFLLVEVKTKLMKSVKDDEFLEEYRYVGHFMQR